MFAQRVSPSRRAPTRFCLWLVAVCALAAAGCRNCTLPRIDPTGERLFVRGDGAPLPPPPPGLPGQWGISLSPQQVIAPVGSEVIMIASLSGPEGYPLVRERVEWMLAPDGVGELVSPGERRPLEVLNWLRRLPRKVDTSYAINTTLSAPMLLDRGTPSPVDDVTVHSGQAWVSVTSPSEGTSHLTVYAPEITGWDRRKQSASIYWVDAQWQFPSPAISAAGSRNTLTTLVTRASDGSPLPGWVVRYEIAGGPPAGFAPGAAQAVEIVTGPNGEAPAEILQSQPAPGTSQVNIQVISPAAPGGPNRQLTVGAGSVLQTWTSGAQQIPYSPPPVAAPPIVQPQAPPPATTPPPATAPPVTTPPPTTPPLTEAPPPAKAELDITITGPTTAVVGSDVQFEIQVVNRGAAPATNVLVRNEFDEGLVHARATGVIERDIADMSPGTVSRLAVTFHISTEGELCQQISVTAAGGVRATARRCITATASPLGPPAAEQPPESPIGEPQPPPTEPEPPAELPRSTTLSVTKKGPDRRLVGETALFVIEVTNHGETAVEDLVIADNFETSLEPSRATGGWEWLPGNTLGWKVDSLAPGRTLRYEVELRCLRPTPQACNRVNVTAAGIEELADQACLEIAAEAATPRPPAAPETPEPPAAAAEIKVEVAETADPIRIEGNTTYQVVVENVSEQSAFDVEVTVKYSDALRLDGINAPVQAKLSAGTVRFTPMRELRAGEKPAFELRFVGARAGTGRVQVEVTSRGQTTPAKAEQTTEVLQ